MPGDDELVRLDETAVPNPEPQEGTVEIIEEATAVEVVELEEPDPASVPTTGRGRKVS